MEIGRWVPRCAFVTNFCPHYREPIFRMLVDRLGVEFYFFGRGANHFWNPSAIVQHLPTRLAPPARGMLDRYRYLSDLSRSLAERPYDVIIKCITGALELPTAYYVARRNRRRFVLWTGLWRHPRTPRHVLGYPLVRHIYRNSDAICTYGTHVRDYLIGKGVDRQKVFVVGQPAPAIPATERSLDRPADRFLFVGRFVPVKGLEYLLTALEHIHTPVTLTMVGEGPLESRLRRRASSIKRLGHRVVFAGLANRSEVIAHYENATALVLPSITTRQIRETWGLVANEAMQMGVPVITTDAVGAAAGGLVQDNVTGLVVPEKNAPALARAMERLLEEKGLAARLSEAARSRVESESYEQMFSQFEAAILHASGQRLD